MRRSRAVLLTAFVASQAAFFADGVRADSPSLDVRRFRPPTDPAGALYLETPLTPGPFVPNFAFLGSYVYRPAVVRTGQGQIAGDLVSYQFTGDLLANIGIGSRLALGLDLPVIFAQTGTWNVTTQDLIPNGLPPAALGDLALTAKLNLVPHDDIGGFGYGLIGRVGLPTGDTESFAGEGAPTAEVRALAEYKVIAVSVQVTGGVTLRTREREFAGRGYGNEIPWGVALLFRPQALGIDSKGRASFAAELHGAKALAPWSDAPAGTLPALSPVFAGLSGRYALGRDFSLFAGVEFAMDRALGDPPFRGVLGLGWAPRAHDQDHDGVDDDHDECPELAEDRDGFEDNDGCPDWDNDDDGVPDGQDQCPNAKEDVDGFQDDDGCPDPDNDGDGILDTDDACPNEAGPRSLDPKRNGCPEKAPASAPPSNSPPPPAAEMPAPSKPGAGAP